MSSQLQSTQFFPITDSHPTVHFDHLEGEWPVLGKADLPSNRIMERIGNEGSGKGLSENLSYLSLGMFYIRTELLEPHPTQRPINQSHIQALLTDFDKVGIMRNDHPGVVIGLGDGWYQMKKTSPRHILIAPNSPHLHRLRAEPDGKIGQVIRGGHRTAAIYKHSEKDKPFQSFWYYEVLVPGRILLNCSHISLLTSHFFFIKKKNSN